jgi:hypothetical protein
MSAVVLSILATTAGHASYQLRDKTPGKPLTQQEINQIAPPIQLDFEKMYGPTTKTAPTTTVPTTRTRSAAISGPSSASPIDMSMNKLLGL